MKGSLVNSFQAHAIFSLSEDSAVVVGRLRWRNPEGGFSDTSAAWAIRSKDGLIWRFRTAATEAQARQIIEQDGWTG
jgi:hypothetical protein